MTSEDPRLHTTGWRTLRLLVLARDGWLCQIRGVGCSTQATAVDHIVEPLDGGSFADPANLRASCRTCNSRKGGRFASARADRFGYRTTQPVHITRF